MLNGGRVEETWHAARLIPTSGIKGAEEQERRGTSALLAVLGSVKEFGRTLTTRLGAPAGVIETYIEVPFEFGDTRLYPDGLIRVTRGSRAWTCLVEVKTGRNDLDPLQLGNYLDIAKERSFDAVLTISNQIPIATGTHPCDVDKRKLRKVALHHLSWSQIHTEAILEKANRSVSDPEQAWILSELIRYLEHPNSSAVDFDDMGPHWVTIRDAVTDGTLRAGDKGLGEVCARFEQLLRYAGIAARASARRRRAARRKPTRVERPGHQDEQAHRGAAHPRDAQRRTAGAEHRRHAEPHGGHEGRPVDGVRRPGRSPAGQAGDPR